MIDTGMPVPRPSEPYKIREDGVKLYLYKSPNNVMIIQHPTGIPYAEARDPESSTYTYTETDIPIVIEPSPIDEDIVQKAEAFDYLTGRSNGNE